MRGSLLPITLAALLMGQGEPAAQPSADHPLVRSADWDAYKSRFLDSTGRIIDDANGNISHSEGQGYGLLLAVMAGSRPDFDLIWSFTRDELLLRNDGLAAWKWDPSTVPHVTDPNNATDGDLLIAYSLALAAKEWEAPELAAAAAHMADTIAQTAVVENQGRLIILPANTGFSAEDRLDGPVVNPSYWIFEMFPVLAELSDNPAWGRLREDGLAMLKQSSTGPRKLPPDWVSLRTMPKPATGFEAEFGYNALRIPLYLVRAGIIDRELLTGYAAGMSVEGGVAISDLETGEPRDTLTDPGYRIIPALIACALDRKPIPADLKTFTPTVYYPSTLQLLALSHPRRTSGGMPMRVASIVWLVAGAAVVGYFGLRDNNPADGFFESRSRGDAAGISELAVPDGSNPSDIKTVQFSADSGAVGQPLPAAPISVKAAPAAQAPAAAPSVNTSAGQVPVVDETALRYFARRGDSKRLEAEIARLRTLYPDWTPPSDPSAVLPQGDLKLDDMWQLYSENRYAEVRKAIADRMAAEPAWRPPQDLLDRLGIAEARDRLVNASNLKQSEMVIRVAANTPSLLTCSEVDVLWRVAEAFATTDRTGRARDAYLYILKNCTDEAERLATIEKAIPLLSRDEMADLLATERIGPDGKGEFDKARVDLARSSVAAAGKDPKVTVPVSDVSAVEAVADRDGQASDAILLGWYYVGRDNPTAAEKWFRKARGVKDTAEVSQGLALALVGLGRHAEAEDVLFPWNDGSDEVRKVYLAAVANLLGGDPPAMVDPAILQRMAPVVGKARDAAAAQQFGWYARALNQHRTASQWFTAALAWKPDDEPSAYGLALTRLQLRDQAGVAEIQRLWAGRSERIAILGETRRGRQRQGALPAPPAEATTASPIAAERQPYDDTVEAPATIVETAERARPAQQSISAPPNGARSQQNRSCKTTRAYSNLGGSESLARAWCLMELNRPFEAIKAFENALERGDAAVQRDAAYGQSLAYLRAGLANEAAVAAAKAPQDRKRTVELDEALLSRRASDFFGAGRYAETILALDQRARIAPERIDLMVLRGYAYLNLKRKEDARRIFRAIAATGDREGLRGLKAVDPPKDDE